MRNHVDLGQLDLDVHTTWQLELGQRVNRLLVGRVNLDEALVSAQLELLPGFLIYVRRPQNGVNILLGGQRNRASYYGPTVFHGFDDLFGGLVYQVVIVRPQFNANFLIHAS